MKENKLFIPLYQFPIYAFDHTVILNYCFIKTQSFHILHFLSRDHSAPSSFEVDYRQLWGREGGKEGCRIAIREN